jgi:ABC-type Na+ efflux pump permease subunit
MSSFYVVMFVMIGIVFVLMMIFLCRFGMFGLHIFKLPPTPLIFHLALALACVFCFALR